MAAGTLLNMSLGHIEIDPLQEQEQSDLFIENFEHGIDAFFPEGLTAPEKAQLFDTYALASQRPNGRTDVNKTIYEARAQIIEQLIDKRFESLEAYHGINVSDVFAMAGWLYGHSEEEVATRGWSVDPVTVYKPNPGLLHIKPNVLQTSAEGLAQDTGMSMSDVLTRAHRGLYRYAQNPQLVQAEISEHRARGTLKQILQRPDILNYPLHVLEQKEADYVAMGIPLDDVRANGKFYVYRTERIEGRIKLLGQSLTEFDCLTSQDHAVLMDRFVTTPRLVLDCGEKKIQTIVELVTRYASVSQWVQALHELGQHRQGDTPQGAVLYYFGRVNTEKLQATMQADPKQNIFLVARDLVNGPKAEQKRAREARRKAAAQ